MRKGQGEIRMIWLMVLIIVGVGAWFLDVRIFTYLCGLAFVMSVMQYVDVIQSPAAQIAVETNISVQENSKVPLYLCSIIAIVGGILDWEFAVGLGITALGVCRRIGYHSVDFFLFKMVTPFRRFIEPYSNAIAAHSNAGFSGC